jgi:hypothetical protein
MLSAERPLIYSLVASGSAVSVQYETCGLSTDHEGKHQATWAKGTDHFVAPGQLVVIRSINVDGKTAHQ